MYFYAGEADSLWATSVHTCISNRFWLYVVASPVVLPPADRWFSACQISTSADGDVLAPVPGNEHRFSDRLRSDLAERLLMIDQPVDAGSLSERHADSRLTSPTFVSAAKESGPLADP